MVARGRSGDMPLGSATNIPRICRFRVGPMGLPSAMTRPQGLPSCLIITAVEHDGGLELALARR